MDDKTQRDLIRILSALGLEAQYLPGLLNLLEEEAKNIQSKMAPAAPGQTPRYPAEEMRSSLRAVIRQAVCLAFFIQAGFEPLEFPKNGAPGLAYLKRDSWLRQDPAFFFWLQQQGSWNFLDEEDTT